MLTKLFEVRDEGTNIPIMATQLVADSDDAIRLLSRAGFGTTKEDQSKYLMVVTLATNKCGTDPYNFGASRTIREAHIYIQKHFDELEDCDVIDVQYILGGVSVKKRSDINPTK